MAVVERVRHDALSAARIARAYGFGIRLCVFTVVVPVQIVFAGVGKAAARRLLIGTVEPILCGKPSKHVGHFSAVILVRMGHYYDVEAVYRLAVVALYVLVYVGNQLILSVGRTAVDKHIAPVGKLHDTGISLPYVDEMKIQISAASRKHRVRAHSAVLVFRYARKPQCGVYLLLPNEAYKKRRGDDGKYDQF